MLHAILTRTWLWLYWMVEYLSFVENECGLCKTVDCEELCSWLEDVLKINSLDYQYDYYENF